MPSSSLLALKRCFGIQKRQLGVVVGVVSCIVVVFSGFFWLFCFEVFCWWRPCQKASFLGFISYFFCTCCTCLKQNQSEKAGFPRRFGHTELQKPPHFSPASWAGAGWSRRGEAWRRSSTNRQAARLVSLIFQHGSSTLGLGVVANFWWFLFVLYWLGLFACFGNTVSCFTTPDYFDRGFLAVFCWSCRELGVVWEDWLFWCFGGGFRVVYVNMGLLPGAPKTIKNLVWGT